MIYKLHIALQSLFQQIERLVVCFFGYPSAGLPVPDFNNSYDETML